MSLKKRKRSKEEEFAIDTTPSISEKDVIFYEDRERSKPMKKTEIARQTLLSYQKSLNIDPNKKPKLIDERSRAENMQLDRFKKIVTRREKEPAPIPKDANESAKQWIDHQENNDEVESQKQKKRKIATKARSKIGVVGLPHPGTSYNPKEEDYKEVTSQSKSVIVIQESPFVTTAQFAADVKEGKKSRSGRSIKKQSSNSNNDELDLVENGDENTTTTSRHSQRYGKVLMTDADQDRIQYILHEEQSIEEKEQKRLEDIAEIEEREKEQEEAEFQAKLASTTSKGALKRLRKERQLELKTTRVSRQKPRKTALVRAHERAIARKVYKEKRARSAEKFSKKFEQLDKIVENIENKEDQIKARAEARLRTKAVEERKVQQSREPSQITINELPGNLRLITQPVNPLNDFFSMLKKKSMAKEVRKETKKKADLKYYEKRGAHDTFEDILPQLDEK